MSAQAIGGSAVAEAIENGRVEKSNIGVKRVVEMVAVIFKTLAILAICVAAFAFPPVGLAVVAIMGIDSLVDSFSTQSLPPQPKEHIAHLKHSPGLDAYQNLDTGLKRRSRLEAIAIKVADPKKEPVEMKIGVPNAFIEFIDTHSEHIFIGSDSLAALLAEKQIAMEDAAPWLLEHLSTLLPPDLTIDQKMAVLSKLVMNLIGDSFGVLLQSSREAVDNRAHDQFDAFFKSRQKKVSIAMSEDGATMRVLMCCDSIFNEDDGNRSIGVRASLSLDIATTSTSDFVVEEEGLNPQDEADANALDDGMAWGIVDQEIIAEPGRLFLPEMRVTTRLLPTAS